MAEPEFNWPGGQSAAVSFSFDDARLSQSDGGIDLLDESGVKATFYVSFAGVEARSARWKKAIADGHEIGNHTISHPCSGNFPFARQNALEDYALERIESEITGANARIETLLGVRARTFAYPCGQSFVGRGEALRSYVPVVARHFLAGRGYLGEWVNDPAFCDLAQLNCAASDGQSAERLREWLDKALANRGWLIFCGHEIGDGGFQTTLRKSLREAFAFLRERRSEFWVDTVERVAAHIQQTRKA